MATGEVQRMEARAKVIEVSLLISDHSVVALQTRSRGAFVAELVIVRCPATSASQFELSIGILRCVKDG